MDKLEFNDKDIGYQKQIVAWLPNEVIDAHTHTGIPEHYSQLSSERKKSSFADSLSEGLRYQSRESILSSYQELFPGLNIRYTSFPFPFREADTKRVNEYIMNSDFPFLLAKPTDVESQISSLQKPKVVGIKVYYDFVDKPYSEIEINDFVNQDIMQVLNRYGKTLMLHVPRESLADKVNLEQVESLSSKFPNTNIILAHMGRCQTEKQAKSSFSSLIPYKNVSLDTSTVSNPKVFEEGLRTVGSSRILYGSDSPLSKVKARIMETDTSFGIGFITKDVYEWTLPELRKWYLENKPELTFSGYHDLLALKEATESLDISREELEDIFSKNAERLFIK